MRNKHFAVPEFPSEEEVKSLIVVVSDEKPIKEVKDNE